MVQSMTGFATKVGIITNKQGKKTSISLSLKSLNSRFFELTCKIPPALSHLETVISKKIKTSLHRGHIYLTVYLADYGIVQGSVDVSMTAVEGYIKALNNIKTHCHIDQPILLDHLVRLPNVFTNQETIADDQVELAFMDMIDELITNLTQARTKEGVDITKDLEVRAGHMQTYIDAIEKGATEFLERIKHKVQETLHEVAADQTIFAETHKAALYALMDKIDIHEEISRFKSHLHNLTNQLRSDTTEKGKLLDFILQELVRETNTITAKCSDAVIGTQAINAKVEIEKMREQVQNIV